jgi:hypothetical protein
LKGDVASAQLSDEFGSPGNGLAAAADDPVHINNCTFPKNT